MRSKIAMKSSVSLPSARYQVEPRGRMAARYGYPPYLALGTQTLPQLVPSTQLRVGKGLFATLQKAVVAAADDDDAAASAALRTKMSLTPI